MQAEKFQIEHLAGDPPITDDKLRQARRVWEPHWELVKWCEDAELTRMEAMSVLLYTLGASWKQIAGVTRQDRRNVGHTLGRAVARLHRAGVMAGTRGRQTMNVFQAWWILNQFRNRVTLKGKGDHGPQVQGTRPGNYREVGAPPLVVAEDLLGEDWRRPD